MYPVDEDLQIGRITKDENKDQHKDGDVEIIFKGEKKIIPGDIWVTIMSECSMKPNDPLMSGTLRVLHQGS